MKTKLNLSICLNKINLLLLLTSLGIFLSCDKDEKTVSDSYQDGLYIVGSATPSETPIASVKMSQGRVDDGLDKPGITRDGYFATFIYLTTGNFTFNSVTNNVITAYGVNDVKTVTFDADGNGSGDFATRNTPNDNFKNVKQHRGTLTENGNAYAITEAGIYFIGYDTKSSQAIIMKIDRVGVVGSALEGWNAKDIELTLSGNATNDGATWEGESLRFSPGSPYKYRFNNGWADSLTIEDGEVIIFQVNIGRISNSNNEHLLGGVNLISDDGKPFKAKPTLTWSGGLAFTSSFKDKTDEPVTDFDATGTKWGIIGEAIGGWDDASENVLAYVSSADGVHTYEGSVTFTATEKDFKFRYNGAWDVNFGFGDSKVTFSGDNTDDLNNEGDGGNLRYVGEANASYKVTLNVTQPYNEVPPSKYEITVVKE